MDHWKGIQCSMVEVKKDLCRITPQREHVAATAVVGLCYQNGLISILSATGEMGLGI